jgi:hypothetical protein
MSSARAARKVHVKRRYNADDESCARALKLLLKGCAGESVTRNEKAPNLALDGGSGAKGSNGLYRRNRP